MAYQMIYTSVKSGLVAGRSGFCTAARHKEIREALVGRIEDLSNQFDRSAAATGTGADLPVIYSHRIVSIREQSYHVLMRIADAGNDYSGRTNHIAHSIVLEPGEVERLQLTPAEAILELIRKGVWVERYDGAAKYFGPEDEIDLVSFSPSTALPADEWTSQAGAPAGAAFLVEPKAAGGAGVVVPDGYDPEMFLRLFSESTLVESPKRNQPRTLWARSFTTLLQSASQRNDYDWHGCVYNSQVHMQQLKSKRYLIELSPGMALPGGILADIAAGKEREAASPTSVSAAVPETSGQVAPGERPVPATVVAPATIQESSAPPATVTETDSAPADLMVAPAISSDLLAGSEKGSGSSRSRSGLLIAGILGVLTLLLVAVFALLFLSPVRKVERELSALLKEGNWAGAVNSLRVMSEEDQSEYVDQSATFSDLKDLVDGYGNLSGEYNLAAYETEKFLQSSGRSQGDPLRQIAEIRKSWERRVSISGLDLPLPGELDRLEKEANETVQGYFQQKKVISDIWGRLIEMQLPETKVGEVRGNVFALNTDAGLLLAQLKDIEAIIPFVEKFQEESGKLHPDKASQSKSAALLLQLSEQLSKLEAKAAGRGWDRYISAVRTKIATFEPAIEAPKMAGNANPAAEGKREEVKVKQAEEKANEDSLLPKTYLVPLLPDSERISYAGIQEMADGFPESLTILPATRYSGAPMEFKKELAEIGGEISMYYFTGSDTVKIFTVEEKETVLQISDEFRRVFGGGFLFGFGAADQKEPDLLLVGQVPSGAGEQATTGDYFLRLPVEEGIRRAGSEGLTLELSEKAGRLLKDVAFAGAVEKYDLVLSDGTGPVSVSGPEAAALSISLSEGMNARIAEQERKLEAYASLREVASKFDGTFGNLGEQLFGLAEGKAKTKGLLVQSVKQPPGRPPKFALAPAPEDLEEIPTIISPTMEDYIDKSGDFIEGPPFFHYLSAHLYDALWDNGISDSRWVGPGVKDTLRDAFGKIKSTDTWSAEEIKEAIRLLGVVTEKAKEYKLATLPKLTEEFPSQKEAEAARKRREKYFRKNQVVATFFQNWETVFTPENTAIAETMILKGGSFEEAALEKMKADLETLKGQQAALAQVPIEELGSFFVNAVVKTPEGRTVVFRILEVSDSRPAGTR
ncbi:MAG: hypothetical protein P1U87_19015 [Verrucomicrobiales bacterium]|nr:hypothetical protein [Verrucomicrobiales bacterium]